MARWSRGALAADVAGRWKCGARKRLLRQLLAPCQALSDRDVTPSRRRREQRTASPVVGGAEAVCAAFFNGAGFCGDVRAICRALHADCSGGRSVIPFIRTVLPEHVTQSRCMQQKRAANVRAASHVAPQALLTLAHPPHLAQQCHSAALSVTASACSVARSTSTTWPVVANAGTAISRTSLPSLVRRSTPKAPWLAVK